MSFFYLVHKDDATVYDQCSKDRRDVEDQINCLISDKLDNFIGPYTAYECRDPGEEFYKYYEEDYKRIASIEKTLRIVTLFMPIPIDLCNYYTYYRGIRWGEAKGCKASKMQDKRSQDIMQLLKGDE